MSRNLRANTVAPTTTPKIPKVYKPDDYTGWTPQKFAERRKQLEFEINRRPNDADNFRRKLNDLTLAENPYKAKNWAGEDQSGLDARRKYLETEVNRRGVLSGNFQKELDDLNSYLTNRPQTGGGLRDLTNLPGDFNWEAYLANNADVANEVNRLHSTGDTRTAQQIAEDHWLNNGRNEGRSYGVAIAPTSGQQPEVSPTPTGEPSTAADLTNYRSPMTEALMQAFGQNLSTLSSYEPKNFEGSPMYQFQLKQGKDELAKLMAARGLTGSGAEIQGLSDFVGRLGADESEKQRQYAEAQMGRNIDALKFITNFDAQERENLRNQGNLDADRLQRYRESQANQAANDKSLLTGLLGQIMGIQAQGSPLTEALQALNSQGDNNSTIAKLVQQFLSNQYQRAVPTGGSGGGSAPPPMPTRPPVDDTNLKMAELLANYGNNAGNNDVFRTILGSLGGLF